jgi:hypothetical protein
MRRSTLILVINLSVLLLVVCIGLAAQVAPYFTTSIITLGIVAVMFIFTEQSMTHAAVEFENRFWTLMAFGLAAVCLFCYDSPIQLAHKPEIAWVVVFVFTFLAHNYDRHLQRLVLTKATNIRRIRSQDFCPENRSNAQEKVVQLRKLLSTIDHVWMSSTFHNFFFLYRVLQVEAKIIALMAEANSDELNLILNNIELALLFYKMKDHKFARCFNRTNLLKLLAVDRINELVIPSRVVLLDSLQRMKLTANPQCELYVQNIIFNTKTDDLSELKTLMDSKGDVNSMHKLIYSDIRSPTVKDNILKYIAHQADIQKAHSKIGSRRGKQRGLLAWRKILSDVDDTLTCSGGSWPAGMDTSYPKKALYPGVLAFYRELDLGTVGADEWDKSTRVGNLAFLSARPHVYKSVSENVSYLKFKVLQAEHNMYTSPTLLAGSLDTGGQFMVKGDSEPLALKKFENFREYLMLYPEYTCIFVGDNGQGDVRTAELVLNDQRFGGNLHRVYVHQVQARHLTYCRNKEATLNSPQIHFFVTYVGAAIDAYRHKLIRANGLRSIMEEACTDFLAIPDSAWIPHTKPKTPAAGAAGTPGSPPVALYHGEDSRLSFLMLLSFRHPGHAEQRPQPLDRLPDRAGGRRPLSQRAQLPRRCCWPQAAPLRRAIAVHRHQSPARPLPWCSHGQAVVLREVRCQPSASHRPGPAGGRGVLRPGLHGAQQGRVSQPVSEDGQRGQQLRVAGRRQGEPLYPAPHARLPG